MTPELPADETRITQLEAEVARLKKFIDDYDVMEPIELRDVKRERDGALAGQAILLKALQECHADKNDGLWGINIPAEARALLDRLQQAEAVVKAARRWAIRKGHGAEGHQCDLCDALAAWEEER